MAEARDYQQHCHDRVLANWGEDPWHADEDVHRTLLINLPTSAGKTFTAGLIINTVRQLGPCLFLADTDELCEQPRRAFYRQFKMQPATEKAAERASLLADVVVGSAQTMMRQERLMRFAPDHFKYIIVDEAHRGSDRNKKIYDYFGKAKVAGLTATAFRGKTSTKTGLADLADYYEHVAFEMGMFDLMDEGYIAPLKVLTLPVQVDISQVHQKSGDFDDSELDTTIRPYYERICELIVEHASNRQIVVFLPLIKSSQEFVKIAEAAGINARHVDGQSPDRKEILNEFGRKEFQLLSNSSLLTTGWDCPPCDCLLNLAPTRSPGLFRQKVGRIGRLLPGVIDGLKTKEERKAAIAASAKPDALILDLLWQTEKFSLQGPADLIAKNAQERDAIADRFAKKSGANDLQGVTAEVQEAHEQKLKAALEASAKRRSQFNDAINLVAAMLHAPNVTDYEPVMKWETGPVTQKQKDWLAKQGMDPESGTDRGHVSAFMNLVFGRKKAGLCSHRAVEALEKKGIAGAISMTKAQAFELLQGDYPISFGKHGKRGTPLRQIPHSYWDWCMGPEQRRWFNENSYPIEFAWADELINPGGCKCIGAYIPPNCPKHPRPAPPVETFDPEDKDEIPF